MNNSSSSKDGAVSAASGPCGGGGEIPLIEFGYNWVQTLLYRCKIVRYGDTQKGNKRDLFARNFFRLFLFLLLSIHGIPFALALAQGVALPQSGLLIPYVKDWVEYAFSFSVLVLILSEKRFSDIQNGMVREFVEQGIVRQPHDKIVEKIDSWNKFRHGFRLQIVLFLAAEISAVKLLWDLLADGHSSWHGIPVVGVLGLKDFLGLQEMPTWCALYVCLVVWPTCNYIIFNWIVNGIRWVSFTRWLSEDLRIDAMHPDQCGGMHIMKYSVLAWSALIITVGVLISFNTLTYAPLPGSATRWDIILEISGFIILALVIFLCPMGWLTWQLFDAKIKAEKSLGNIGRDCALVVSTELKDIMPLTRGKTPSMQNYIETHAYMVILSQNIAAMKIWPLDIMSVAQIMSSVGGPLAAMLIPDLVRMVLGK
ncbi:MAG: hypothetical protein HW377_1933 [Actinobacteria bacterium]|nr:hypothetical protein [Actinomycetota bacterium]